VLWKWESWGIGTRLSAPFHRTSAVDSDVPKPTRVSRALRQALKSLGAKSKARTVSGVQVITASVPGNVPLVRCAWAVSVGVREAGGTVTAGTEEKGKIILELACDSLPYARLVLASGPRSEDQEAKLALVIDDVGSGPNDPVLQGFLEPPAPLSLSILPDGTRSKDLAEKIPKYKKEVLLHLPMEPKNYPEENPGPQAIYVDLKEGEIRRRVREALKAVPGARGLDNHMGSRATEDMVVMQALLEELKKQDLFFVDAMTTPNSVGLDSARKLAVRATQSSGFFDDKQDLAIIQKTLLSLGETAKVQHRVLAIGHCRPKTLSALQTVLPKLREMGVELVPASEVVEE